MHGHIQAHPPLSCLCDSHACVHETNPLVQVACLVHTRVCTCTQSTNHGTRLPCLPGPALKMVAALGCWPGLPIGLGCVCHRRVPDDEWAVAWKAPHQQLAAAVGAQSTAGSCGGRPIDSWKPGYTPCQHLAGAVAGARSRDRERQLWQQSLRATIRYGSCSVRSWWPC